MPETTPTPRPDDKPSEAKGVGSPGSRTLADAMANAIISGRADEIMVEAENENDLVHRLAWLVRELADVVGGLGSEIASLRLESRGLSLRDQFAVHAPPRPRDWAPEDAARWPWHYADLCLSNRGVD